MGTKDIIIMVIAEVLIAVGGIYYIYKMLKESEGGDDK